MHKSPRISIPTDKPCYVQLRALSEEHGVPMTRLLEKAAAHWLVNQAEFRSVPAKRTKRKQGRDW
jgi:hypothetical protein